jgi:hypothetical protein
VRKHRGHAALQLRADPVLLSLQIDKLHSH